MLFFLLINVKMPTTVGILTFISGKKFCSSELSMIFFYNLVVWKPQMLSPFDDDYYYDDDNDNDNVFQSNQVDGRVTMEDLCN